MKRFLLIALLAGCAGSTSPPTPAEAPRDHIKIPHDVHAKADVKCITCHEGVWDETALGTGKSVMPDEETCLGCHQEEKDKGNCNMCHTDVKHATKAMLAEGSVVMNHKDHIERVKEDCSTCHKQLPAPFVTEATVPKMSDCLACHDHGKQYAQANCAGCHPSLNKLALKPVSDFSHQGNFVARHGAEAHSSAETCAQCHDQTFCSDCHARTVATRIEVKFPEQVASQFIHRNDFLGRHSIEAAGNDATCRRCHGNDFCTSCHTAQNLTPVAANPRDPHPLGWTIPGTKDFHGEAARRDIASCAACHDQGPRSNCVSCHRVGGIGGNPHPTSWLSHHDHSEIQGNGMCATCHI
jgi:cytochrome c7-like protein